MRLAAVLTDLGYLLAASFPTLNRGTSRYFGWRYRRLASAYDQIVDKGGLAYSAPLRAALAELPRQVQWAADVGAGTGAAAREVHARFPNVRLIALDLSRTMLARLTSPRAVRVVARVSALPLRAGALDLIVVQNAPPDFGEMLNALRPEGVVIFSLSSGARLPVGLRRWLLARALPKEVGLPREVVAGNGISWVVRRRARSSG